MAIIIMIIIIIIMIMMMKMLMIRMMMIIITLSSHPRYPIGFFNLVIPWISSTLNPYPVIQYSETCI